VTRSSRLSGSPPEFKQIFPPLRLRCHPTATAWLAEQMPRLLGIDTAAGFVSRSAAIPRDGPISRRDPGLLIRRAGDVCIWDLVDYGWQGDDLPSRRF